MQCVKWDDIRIKSNKPNVLITLVLTIVMRLYIAFESFKMNMNPNGFDFDGEGTRNAYH